MGKKKTIEEFKNNVINLGNNNYQLISTEYINNKTKVKIKHLLCNNIYEVRPDRFINGDRCPYCIKNKKLTDKEFKDKVFNLVGNEYEILDNYINCHTKITIKHNECNTIYKVQPNDFIQGYRCPKCKYNIIKDKLKKSNNDFKQELFNLVGNEYSLLSEYINNKTKVKIKHNICNHIFEMVPNNFILLNNRCPYCKSSKGEIKISNYLNNHNINYIKEYKFNDCKYKKELLFDFYLEDLNILIEYDGIQHYESVNIFGGEENFKLTQLRDNIKNKYCKDNNIKLIRIKYTDYNNIDSILNEEFKNFL